MTNQQGAPEAPKVRTADYEAGWKDGYKQGAWAAQRPAPSAAAAPEGGPPGSGGWEKHAIEMERQRDYYRQRCHTMEEHQNGSVWYWQGDDGDNLVSMGNSMLVVIRADQLRALMQPSPTAQAAESVPAIQGETNVQLDTDPNTAAPGQQRDVARSVALGQPMGHGPNQVAGHLGAQGDKLLTVAERNIRSFLRSAQFKGEPDREAALNCVDVLWAAARAPAQSVTAPSETTPHPACKPDMLVNGGALILALNVLRRAGKHEVAGELEATAQPSPTAQADSQPAPEYVGNGMFKGETIEKAAEHWANWCDVRCMTGLSEFLRVVAARAQADSVTAPATQQGDHK